MALYFIMNIAIVGATGLVGKMFLEILEERNFLYNKIYLVASKSSSGKQIKFNNQNHVVLTIDDILDKKIDLAFFSAGSDVSKKWAPILADKGCKVIDNSSYWRMCSKHKLVVPEINSNVLTNEDKIIANPNCSTIQLLMVLNPVHKKYNIQRVIVSTYQSVSGTGQHAVKQLENEERGINQDRCYQHQIHRNVIPQCDDFEENGYTKEEMKLVNETQKILDKKILVSATAVRVPVLRGHSESVNIKCSKPIDISELKKLLNSTEGVSFIDQDYTSKYPMPLDSEGKDQVYVGRLRKDLTQENCINAWIVSDNLRKGAALNAIQIGEFMLRKGFLNR